MLSEVIMLLKLLMASYEGNPGSQFLKEMQRIAITSTTNTLGNTLTI